MHFGQPGDNPSKAFGVALYDIDRSRRQKTCWTVFELSDEHFEFFRKRGHVDNKKTAGYSMTMLVRLLDAEGKVVDSEEFLPTFDESRVPPRPGTTGHPPVVLEGIRSDPEERDRHVGVSLDLMNPGMTEDGIASRYMPEAINGRRTGRKELVPMFPIAPLFSYRFAHDDAHAYSPEVRLAVTFKGLEVSAVERVKKVDCSVSVAEQPKRTTPE